MFHAYAHSFSFLKSAFISNSRLFLFLNMFMRATSSANMNMSDFMPVSMSVKYIKNKSDESIDPCGTEPKIFTKSDACYRRRLVGICLIYMILSILGGYLYFQVCATYILVVYDKFGHMLY